MPGYARQPAYNARNISLSPAGDLAATNLQTGLEELDSDLSSGLASKLDLAGGKILQIVRATDATNRTTTSTSFVDVPGMSVTITPQKADSAILVIATYAAQADSSTTSNLESRFRIADSSDNPISGANDSYGVRLSSFTGSGTRIFISSKTLIGYATPATTAATTYKLRFKGFGNNISVRNDVQTGQMIAIEVSA